jgi:type III secretion system YscD/HrpQ family protein
MEEVMGESKDDNIVDQEQSDASSEEQQGEPQAEEEISYSEEDDVSEEDLAENEEAVGDEEVLSEEEETLIEETSEELLQEEGEREELEASGSEEELFHEETNEAASEEPLQSPLETEASTPQDEEESKEEPAPAVEQEAPPSNISPEELEEELHAPSDFNPEMPLGEIPAFQQLDLELTDTGRWLLKVVSGPNNGAEFSLQPGQTYLMGTDPNICDIVFHDNSVSRQHARLTVTAEDTLQIEDLNSRNGTMVDAQPLEKKQPLEPNILVTLGSTSFVIIDREGQMQTIISPFLPSIVKILQEKPSEAEKAPEMEKVEESQPLPAPIEVKEEEKAQPHKEQHVGMILLTAIVIGLGAVAVTAVTSLFSPATTVVVPKRDLTDVLKNLEKQYPSLRFSFNANTGRLLVSGHVLTGVDRHELLYQLQAIPDFQNIDDKVIVDEYVWQEANQILGRIPAWRGISVHAFTPGKFILSGELQTHEQAERLYDYISSNFPYLDMLDKQVFIEEDIVSEISNALRKHGFPDIKVQMSGGSVSLSGGVPQTRRAEFQTLMTDFGKISGVREVRNLAYSLAPDQAIKDISDKYEVTGFSQTNNKNSVIIGRRAINEGDSLDGMHVEKITPKEVLLDKDGVKYRSRY